MKRFVKRSEISRILVLSFCMAVALTVAAKPVCAQSEPGPATLNNKSPKQATYAVRVLRASPPKLAVMATLPIDGQKLMMDTTRPGDIEEILKQGWPALITNLRVSGAAGKALEVTRVGASGWELARPHTGLLKVAYEVDYSLPAARGWPAPREGGFAEADHFALAGRSLFITTQAVGSSIVTFALPRSWRAVTPWKAQLKAADKFTVDSPANLVENLIVLTRSSPDVITAGGFQLLVIPMGHWKSARTEITRLLGGVVNKLVSLVGFNERETYLVVLLPMMERGGESFRRSFAMTFDAAPSRANRSNWGNTIAHEVFHYWNGWRLRGADYAASQWFQEGFTEYAANLAMVSAGLVSEVEFREKLAEHIRNYRRLTTTLEAPGSQKGPPLYSGGALVAFSWDVLIRHASGGKHDIGDFFRALWRETGRGQRAYEWRDIRAALNSVAQRDWDSFYNAHIRGTEPLPIQETVTLAGLRIAQAKEGSSRVEIDVAAPLSAKSLWRALVKGQ